MYYYPVSAVLTECLILSVVEPDSEDGSFYQGIHIVSDPSQTGDGWLSDNLFRGISGTET